jgi:hypothetical protein
MIRAGGRWNAYDEAYSAGTVSYVDERIRELPVASLF